MTSKIVFGNLMTEISGNRNTLINWVMTLKLYGNCGETER